ncbi:MAG TPA: hypothetical protein IGS17_12770 [Oscillatoriales cyanobacterium M59_W2019_021]|nr:hypothetical protein [Oscillatoriales cyanobacterium M4454_W2019_049]HIK51776.1 hypothetical protein [Oscillatoriales cyanobacterium M59_W2019_021]
MTDDKGQKGCLHLKKKSALGIGCVVPQPDPDDLPTPQTRANCRTP